MPRNAQAAVRRRRAPRAASALAVQRAVSGTLNRPVEVEVEKRTGRPERWSITFLVQGRRSPAILVSRIEMDAMRQVPLVPAHLRGHFLRNYSALERQAGPQS